MQDSKILRKIDYYVGRPACRAISWARAVTHPSWRKQPARPKRVLMVELFEMGAGVMLLPSIAFLRKQDPAIEVHCLTTTSCLPVWKATGVFKPEELHVIEGGSAVKFLMSAALTLLKLRSINFDLILDYELFMRISAIFVGVLKGRRRSGFYRYRHEGLQRGDYYQPYCAYNQNAHISRNYLALTKTAYEGRADSPNFKDAISLDELKVPRLERKGASKVDGRYIALCPDVGPTLSVRNYPRESFAKVIDGLLERYPAHKLVLIGTEHDRATSEAILALVTKGRDRCVDLCGKTSFDELIPVIAAAELLITNDNGPAHFATLTGTRTVALFSTDSPFVYGPLGDTVIAYTFFQCSPCISAYNHKSSVCDNNRCLQTLAPSKVLELATSVLEGKARYRTVNNELPYVY